MRTAAIGYVRVSREEEASNGHGLDAQASAIRAECERRGWDLIDVVRERGASGRSLDRPELKAALERIVAGEAGTLVAARLDRLTRSVGDFAVLLDHAAALGFSVVVLDPAVDMTTPYGRAMAQMASVFAELERELIGQRTREGLAAARAKGRRPHPAVADNEDLHGRIVELREEGLTLQAIADRLNADGVATIRGGSEWRPSAVQSALGYRRPTARRKPVALPGAGLARPRRLQR